MRHHNSLSYLADFNALALPAITAVALGNLTLVVSVIYSGRDNCPLRLYKPVGLSEPVRVPFSNGL